MTPPNPAGRLAGKVCVITSAAGGIGSASADRFRLEGGTVVGVDLVDGGVSGAYTTAP